MKQLAILGSTGSIGKQALDVVSKHSDEYEVQLLTANDNWQELARQARQFAPDAVVIANEAHYAALKDALADKPVKVYAGSDAINQCAAAKPVDIVLNAIVGFAGLTPTINAIKAGKVVALANKESLVVAGELVNRLVAMHNAAIIPVDSEHSAIFQCLSGEVGNEVEKIILTASGGPFRLTPAEQLARVTKDDAMRHPVWSMGAKITIDSATMMNKGFEVIEAKWLFGVPVEDIEVVVHPQSLVHSMVQFADGAVKAQLGMPDMRIPIQYALSYPDRIPTDCERLDFTRHGTLTFERPDTDKFRNLGLAYEAMRRGGNIPCALNAANEVAVHAFLHDRIGFMAMSDLLEEVLAKTRHIASPTLEDYMETDRMTRIMTQELIR